MTRQISANSNNPSLSHSNGPSDGPADKKIRAFIDKLWKYHAEHRRDLPWRNTKDPYKILLSELMLQQTQVPRVLQKYDEFLINFPTLQSVHKASMTDVLRVWKGLGYNRRAYFIKKIAAELATTSTDPQSRLPEARTKSARAKSAKAFVFPSRYEDLIKLPGIGQSTGGALVAFSFAAETGQKIAFIETNIRSVLTHEFFIKKNSDASQADQAKEEKVKDVDVAAMLQQCLDHIDPKDIREFYYALYDYGTHLKSVLGKEKTALHKRSAHYAKQSSFKGSVREMRSLILGALLNISQQGNAAQADKNALFEMIKPDLPSLNRDKRQGKPTKSETDELQSAERARFETAIERMIKDGSITVANSISNGRKRDIIEIC